MGQALQGGMMNTAQGGQFAAPAQGGAAAAAPSIMSPAEAANYLKVGEADIMQMITEGQIKAKKIGSQYRISKDVLDDFLKS
jgi:excisionase family DNA binding protein